MYNESRSLFIISVLYSVPELSFTTEVVMVSEDGVMAQICLRLSEPLSFSITVPLIFETIGSATQGIT